MKQQLKLTLIDNYISLHRILIHLKGNILNSPIKEHELCKTITKATEDLISLYDQTFKSCRMENSSLLLLKRDLNYSLNAPLTNNIGQASSPTTIEEILTKLAFLKENLNAIAPKLIKIRG